MAIATYKCKDLQTAISQKHLVLILDSKLHFNENISNKINKCPKIIRIMKKLSLFLSRKTILKSFVRPNLDYAYIIYDKPFNEYFKTKIEIIQYRAALITTEAIKGAYRDRLNRL